MKSPPRSEAIVMDIHHSCPPKRVLFTPKYKLERTAKTIKAASQAPVATALIKTLLTEAEAAQICRFELGDNIMTYSPNLTQNSPPSEADDLFLIASGTVRLLAHNKGLQKIVSVARLGSGDAFGCDRTFCEHPLPYWAKAAAPCQLVQLPGRAVARALRQWPLVMSHLQQHMQRRSQLAFFKQCTPLGAVPSTTLDRRLLPHLVEQPLSAGSTLNQYPLVGDEYLWLRQGGLLNPADPNCSLQMGDGWRYSTPLGNWIAQSDGLLYRLVGNIALEDAIKRLL